MLAYAGGKNIQFSPQGKESWQPCKNPMFDFCEYAYRVQPESQYRPFKNEDECFEEMKKHEPFGWVYADLLNEFNGALMQITLINNKGYRFVTDRKDRSYSDAFEINSVYFADGTPFGIKEEE